MNNLFEFTSEMKKKIEEWAKNFVSGIKDSLYLGTQNSKLRNEVGKYLAEDTFKGFEESGEWAMERFNTLLEILKYKRKTDVISEDEYYTQLEVLRNRFLRKGTQSWLNFSVEIYQHQKKVLDKEKKSLMEAYSEVSKYASDRLSEVLEKQERYAERIKSETNIFNKNTVKMGGMTDVYYSMHDFREDINRIKQYQQLLGEFSERADKLGISPEIQKEFLRKLADEDIYTSINLLNSIKSSSDNAFNNYLSSWSERNRLIDELAASTFKEEFNEAAEDVYDKMKGVLLKAGYEIPEDFFSSGSLSAQRFGDAFVTELEEQFKRIRSVIESFNSEVAGYARLSDGITYNTSNTSYNIQAANAGDTVEQIRRYETVKRLAGIA